MAYRCVKSVSNDDVIAIGNDENQAGPYYDMGIWCDFTVDVLPEISIEVLEYVSLKLDKIPLYKVVNNQIVAKTLEEVQS